MCFGPKAVQIMTGPSDHGSPYTDIHVSDETSCVSSLTAPTVHRTSILDELSSYYRYPRTPEDCLDHNGQNNLKYAANDDVDNNEATVNNNCNEDDLLLRSSTSSSLEQERSSDGGANSSCCSQFVICGRQGEWKTLREAFQRVATKRSSEVVLVYGVSGVGKSALVEAMRQPVVNVHGGFFCQGKYNQKWAQSPSSTSFLGEGMQEYLDEIFDDDHQQHACNEPFSGLVEAFTDLCDLWMMQSAGERAEMVQNLRRTMRCSEIQTLIKLVSNLAFLMHQHPKLERTNPDCHDENENTDDRGTVSKINNDALRLQEQRPDHFVSMAQAQVRFHQLCQTFLRAAASADHPVLIFLDDVQWADTQSKQVIQALLQDPLSQNILFVLAYRTNDDDESEEEMFFKTNDSQDLSWLWQQQQLQPHVPHCPGDKSESQTQSCQLPLTKIGLSGLGLGGVREVVQQLFPGNDPDNVLQLSRVLLHKTSGNVYFVLQLLESLKEQGLVYREASDGGRWGWEDVDEIQAVTNVSDNVVQLVFRRVHQLRPRVIQVLKIAAAIGYHFDYSTLSCVFVSQQQQLHEDEANFGCNSMVALDMSEEDRQSLDRILEEAALKHIIELTSIKGRYKFSHDRMQQCLYELVLPGEEQDLLHFRIGSVIWHNIRQSTAASTPVAAAATLAGTISSPLEGGQYLLAADHMNRARNLLMNPQSKLELARLNRQAGKWAAEKSAFLPAIEFVQAAISLIGHHRLWDDENYELALDLHNTLAELQNSSGRFVESAVTAKYVLQSAKTFSDKHRGYWALVIALGASKGCMEAVEVGFDVLRQLGERFPKRTTLAHVGLELARTIRSVGNRSDEELLNLPIMTDPNKIAAMNMLGELSLQTYMHWSAKNDFALVGMRMMRLSCKYGVTSMSPFALSQYASVQAVMGRHDAAVRYAKVALRMLERLDTRQSEARTLAMIHHFVLHWREPWQTSLDAFQRSYTIGLETGDVDFAFAAAVGRMTFMFYAASNLGVVVQESFEVLRLLDDFKHRGATLVMKPGCQVALNLMGHATDPLVLTGEVMIEEEIVLELLQENNGLMDHYFGMLKLQLALFFESSSRVKRWIKKCDRTVIELRGHYGFYTNLFTFGSTYFWLYRKYGVRRYKQKALAICRRIKRLLDQGCTNAEPFHCLLDAERLSLRPDVAKAKIAYDGAVAVAKKQKSKMFEAMSYETAGMGLADRLPDVAEKYTRQAISSWREYGALAMVSRLTEKHKTMLANAYDDAPRTPDTVEVH